MIHRLHGEESGTTTRLLLYDYPHRSLSLSSSASLTATSSPSYQRIIQFDVVPWLSTQYILSISNGGNSHRIQRFSRSSSGCRFLFRFAIPGGNRYLQMLQHLSQAKFPFQADLDHIFRYLLAYIRRQSQTPKFF